MVLYSPDWTNTGFSFILLTVNLFRHSKINRARTLMPISSLNPFVYTYKIFLITYLLLYVFH